MHIIDTSNLESLTQAITCDTTSKQCMYGECEKCSNNTYALTSHYRATDRVSYLQWATVDKEHKNDPGAASKITLKKEFECSQEELVETFAILLQKFRRHLYNIRQQYAFSRALKLNLPANECAVHIDFSENYGCKYSAEEQAVEDAVKEMPADLPAVPSTMRLHQVVTLSPGKILYRDVSCMCSVTGNLECDCQKTKSFSFNTTDDHTEDPIYSQPEEVEWHSPEVVGKWCALVYDHTIYPGIIQEVNETHCQVKCMHKVGENRFFWPLREDLHWYPLEDVLTLIPPPENVTARHMAIAREMTKCEPDTPCVSSQPVLMSEPQWDEGASSEGTVQQLEKLQAAGYKPVLLLGKATKKSHGVQVFIPRCTLATFAEESLKKMGSIHEYICQGWTPFASGTAEGPEEGRGTTQVKTYRNIYDN
ncbi:unnamed protein product [Gadus morhua 'NCC']